MTSIQHCRRASIIKDFSRAAMDDLDSQLTRQALQRQLAEARQQLTDTGRELADTQLQLADIKQESSYLLDALRLSPLALCHQDLQLRYTWLQNPHMGFTMEESLGKTDQELLPGELADRMAVIKRRVIATGIGERVEMPTVPGDSHSEYFELTVEPLADVDSGELLGITCSGMDVTEDRRRREAYRASEENLQFIFNASIYSIVVLDQNASTPLFFNRAAEQLFGLSQANSGEEAFTSLLGVADDFFYSLEEGTSDLNIAFTNVEGLIFTLAMSARSIFYSGAAALLVTFHDRTKQLKAEADLRDLNVHLENRVEERTNELTKMNEELNASNRAKTDFLAKMSHELRTPMNSIIGYTHRLMKKLDGELQPRHMDALDTVRRNGEHLLGLINSLLDLSKIEAGKMSICCNPVHVDCLIADVVSKIEPLMSEKKLSLVINGMPSDDVIMADPQKLVQILLNLLSNAQKFTDKGRVTIGYFTEPKWACFSVEDTGCGIPACDIEGMFGEYSQTLHNKGGTGLGLALVKQLVELHDGEVEMTSEFGKGTRCVLRLPFQQQPFLARRSGSG